MSVNYSATVAASRLEAVRTALNASGGGKIKLRNSSNTILVSVLLETSIGAPVGKVLTVIATAKAGTATAAGTAANAILTNGADVTVADGLTVGTAASDVILNDVALLIGSQVTLNSGTITTP
jgi:hypothetical protein